jgi:hypothetical protein
LPSEICKSKLKAKEVDRRGDKVRNIGNFSAVAGAAAMVVSGLGATISAASPATAAGTVPVISRITMPNISHGRIWYSVKPGKFTTQGSYHYRYLRWSRWTSAARATGQQHLYCLGAGHCSRGWHNDAVTIRLSNARHGSFTKMTIYYHAARVTVIEHFHYSGQLRGWY